MFIEHKIIIKYIIAAFIFFTCFFILSGCFAPRYRWEYRLLDKSPATIIFEDYKISIEMIDYNWEKEKDPKQFYNAGVGFKTYYVGLASDSLLLDSIALIIIDSICVHLLTSKKRICPMEIGVTGSHDRLVYYDRKWHGPIYGVSFKIPHCDENIQLDFCVVLKHRVSEMEIKKQYFSIELKRFYDRYWILAQ